MPLSCDSPTLQSWLTHLKWGCSILGVPCDTYIDTEMGICPNDWSPLTIAGTATVVTILLVLLLSHLTASLQHMLRYALIQRDRRVQ